MDPSADPTKESRTQIETRDQIPDVEQRLPGGIDGLGGELGLVRLAGQHVDHRKTLGPNLPGHRSQLRDCRQQGLGIRVARRHEQCAGLTHFDASTLVHDDGAVGDLGHHTHVMGDEHYRHAENILELFDQLQDLRLDGHI